MLVNLNRIRTLFQANDLRSRILQGGGILTIGSFSENLLRFLRNMIVAKLLAPDAVGLMATIIATVAAAEAFSEVGLTESVIQNKRGAEKEFLNIIWWLSSLRSITLYIVIYFATPFISNFLRIPEATVIIRSAAVVILLRGIRSPNIYLLQKELKFTKWVLLTQSASIFGVLIAVTMAFYIRNVWALVAGYISEYFMICILSYVFYPIMPKFKFNAQFAREIMRFSRKYFGLPILMVLYVQTDNFVIGKLLSLNSLGLYYLARNLADVPNTIFSKISPIILPVFSLIQDERETSKETLLKLIEIVSILGVPFFTFFIVFAHPILTVTYSAEYSAIAIPFSILCSYSFIYIISALIMNVVIATGHPDKHRTASLIRTCFYLIVLYPATKYFGLIGAAISTLVSMCLCLGIQIHYLDKLINITVSEYFARFIKGVKYSCIVLIPGLLINTLIPLQQIGAICIGALLCTIAWWFGIVEMKKYKKLPQVSGA